MAQEYFSDLNYTLANEDTQIENDLLKSNAKSVFSISGSGARCLPLIAKNPAQIDIVDMSVNQLYLSELRYQAMKTLTYPEYLFLLGYRGALQGGNLNGDSRMALYNRLNLSAAAKSYWESQKPLWNQNGFIKLGRWESHFQKIGYFFRDILKCDFSPVFEAQSLQEQIELYEAHWPKTRWNTFMRIAASEYVFNKFLYKGHFSGRSEVKTEQKAPYEFIREEFDRIFRTQLVRKNYFMQVLFLGKIKYEEGLPLEAHQHTFEAVKNSTTSVRYLHANLLEILRSNTYDFISLSDTISYIDENEARQILQGLPASCPSGTTMVIRSFLRAPRSLDTKGWKVLENEANWAQQTDGTGIYRFHIYQKN